MSETSELDDFSTLEILEELRRRQSVLGKPEKSVVLVGKEEDTKIQAKFLNRFYGLCGIDGLELYKNPKENVSENFAKKLSENRCRRGFALFNFGSQISDMKQLDKILQVDFPKKRSFNDYTVISIADGNKKDSSDDNDEVRKYVKAHNRSFHTINLEKSEESSHTISEMISRLLETETNSSTSK